MFKQKFDNGWQIEQADTWLCEESPWQFVRHDRKVSIPINGRVESYQAANGRTYFSWVDTNTIYGVHYDFPIVGYQGKSVNYLRLFSAKTDDELDIKIFNEGGYMEAVKDKNKTEYNCKFTFQLIPNPLS